MITVDDGVPIEARVALVAVANGRFFGGGMMIAPDAELDDGAFDIVIVRAAGKLKLIWDHPAALRRPASQPSVDHHPARQESGCRTARRSASPTARWST